jgi:hypothetical protein
VTAPPLPATALDDASQSIEEDAVGPDVRTATADDEEEAKEPDVAAPDPEEADVKTPPRPASPTHVLEQGIEATARDAAGVEWSTPSLHEVRMSLFHQHRQPVEEGRRDEPRDVEGAPVPGDFARRMEAELEAVRSQLEQLRQRETQLASVSEQRHHAAALSTEKLMLERLQLEEKLRAEAKRNAELSLRVSDVEGENADLRNALTSEKLKNAKLVVAKRNSSSLAGAAPPPDALSPASTFDAGEAALASPAASAVGASAAAASAVGTEVSAVAHASAVLIGLRADLVQARAELAEAHAARLSAEHAQGGLEDKLKAKDAATTTLRSLISELERQKDELLCRADRAMEDHKAGTARLEAQLQEAQSSLKESKLQVQSLSEAQAQLEQAVAASENDAAALREETGELRGELEKVREESEKRLRRSEDLVQQLRDEVRSLNERLVHSGAMVVSQAAEHVRERRKFEAELAAASGPSSRPAAAHRARLAPAARGEGHADDDRSSAAGSAATTASTSASGLRRLLMSRSSQDVVAELLQRSKSFQSQG